MVGICDGLSSIGLQNQLNMVWFQVKGSELHRHPHHPNHPSKTQDTSEPRKRAISIKETPKPGKEQLNQTGIQDNISHELIKYPRQQNLSKSTAPVLRVMESMDGLILLSYRL